MATRRGQVTVPQLIAAMDDRQANALGEDYLRRRIYLPLADMERFGVSEEQIRDRQFTPEFRNLMEYEVGFAEQLFQQGLPLLDRVDRELAVDLRLFSRGGQEILRAIARQNYDVLRSRPVISKPRKAALLLRAVAAKLAARQAA